MIFVGNKNKILIGEFKIKITINNEKYIINNSEEAYHFCKNVEDRKEVRNLITDSQYAYWYCQDVKNRKEIRKYINSYNAFEYFK